MCKNAIKGIPGINIREGAMSKMQLIPINNAKIFGAINFKQKQKTTFSIVNFYQFFSNQSRAIVRNFRKKKATRSLSAESVS